MRGGGEAASYCGAGGLSGGVGQEPKVKADRAKQDKSVSEGASAQPGGGKTKGGSGGKGFVLNA